MTISSSGRRRAHLNRDREHCTGSGVLVGETEPVWLDDLPPVVMPGLSVHRNWARPKPDDPRLCVCGWRPKRKGDGSFAAHRTRPDDPTAPYCPNGAERSY